MDGGVGPESIAGIPRASISDMVDKRSTVEQVRVTVTTCFLPEKTGKVNELIPECHVIEMTRSRSRGARMLR